MGWRGLPVVGMDMQNEVDPKKNTIFVIEKHIEDVKQGQGLAPDLVGSIMKPSDHVKEELRRILMKMNQFQTGAKMREFRVSTFQPASKMRV